MTEAPQTLLAALDQFHFLRPWWLLAILPGLAAAWLIYRRRLQEGAWSRVVSPHLLPYLLQGYVGGPQRLPAILLAIAWTVTSIALAGPTWRTLPQPVQKQLHAQIIVFDLSLSMYADDLKPSRLERARFKLRDILEQSTENLTGLVVFSGSAHVVTPLTDDTNTIINMINGLSPDIMPVKGSNPLEAIEMAKNLLTQANIADGHIILMTDDLDDSFVMQAQTLLDTNRMPVSILALGTADGAPIRLPDGNLLRSAQGAIVVPGTPVARLRQAANALQGRFAELSADSRDINHILGLRTAILDSDRPTTEREFDVWHETGPWLLILLLPLVAAGYRRGWLGVLLVCLLPASLLTSPVAHANPWQETWQNLWQTPDQQGQEAWRQGDFERAQQRFADPLWKGGAAYRAGDWEAAAKHYAEQDSAQAHYNRGNALARQGELEQAISAYQRALSLDPELKDAEHNRAVVEKLRQQQQQQQQGKQDPQSGGKQQQDSEPQSGDQSAQQQDQQEQQDQQQASGGEPKQDGEEQSDPQNAQQDKSDQPPQDQEQQQPGEQKESAGDDSTTPPGDPNQPDPNQQEQQTQQAQATETQDEMEQARAQWLRRVPDDPGGLLRNKFQQESRLRRQTDMKGVPW